MIEVSEAEIGAAIAGTIRMLEGETVPATGSVTAERMDEERGR